MSHYLGGARFLGWARCPIFPIWRAQIGREGVTNVTLRWGFARDPGVKVQPAKRIRVIVQSAIIPSVQLIFLPCSRVRAL